MASSGVAVEDLQRLGKEYNRLSKVVELYDKRADLVNGLVGVAKMEAECKA
jgi:hypothetical protein